MVNKIYNLAHGGLSDMISARAATNILKKALKSSGYDKASLDYFQIKEIMQGYVFEELRNILPSQGVKRQIKNILKDIAEEHSGSMPKLETEEPVLLSEDESIPVPEAKVTKKDKLLPPEKELVAAIPEQSGITTYVNEIKAVFGESAASFSGFDATNDTSFDNVLELKDDLDEVENNDLPEKPPKAVLKDSKYDDISDDLFDAVSRQNTIFDEEELEKAEEKPVKVVANKKKPIHRKQTKESTDFAAVKLDDLEQLLQNFALVEEARAVAIVSNSGKLLSSRGKGFDLDKMASLSNMALMLLKRSGKIRSYHLLVDGSQLFLFPVAEHLVVVIGSQEINFGEVIAVFGAFEEKI